jgi:hypothetical protein
MAEEDGVGGCLWQALVFVLVGFFHLIGIGARVPVPADAERRELASAAMNLWVKLAPVKICCLMIVGRRCEGQNPLAKQSFLTVIASLPGIPDESLSPMIG